MKKNMRYLSLMLGLGIFPVAQSHAEFREGRELSFERRPHSIANCTFNGDTSSPSAIASASPTVTPPGIPPIGISAISNNASPTPSASPTAFPIASPLASGGPLDSSPNPIPSATPSASPTVSQQQYRILLASEANNGSMISADTYLMDSEGRVVKQVGHADVGLSGTDYTQPLDFKSAQDSPFPFEMSISLDLDPQGRRTATLINDQLFTQALLGNQTGQCFVNPRY